MNNDSNNIRNNRHQKTRTVRFSEKTIFYYYSEEETNELQYMKTCHQIYEDTNQLKWIIEDQKIFDEMRSSNTLPRSTNYSWPYINDGLTLVTTALNELLHMKLIEENGRPIKPTYRASLPPGFE